MSLRGAFWRSSGKALKYAQATTPPVDNPTPGTCAPSSYSFSLGASYTPSHTPAILFLAGVGQGPHV